MHKDFRKVNGYLTTFGEYFDTWEEAEYAQALHNLVEKIYQNLPNATSTTVEGVLRLINRVDAEIVRYVQAKTTSADEGAETTTEPVTIDEDEVKEVENDDD